MKLTQKDHILHLTGEVLRDLARNESASREMRKAAVEILMDKNHPFAGHPELRLYVLEIQAEREAKKEVEAQVEAQIEHAEPEETVELSKLNGHAPCTEDFSVQSDIYEDMSSSIQISEPTEVPHKCADDGQMSLVAGFTTQNMYND